MIRTADVNHFISQLAPLELAEDWDNVGLLVGDSAATVQRVMTCLTITPESAREAIDAKADLIVTHHPLPFRPLKRLTTDDPTGKILLQLIRANIAVISPHTAFDSASTGINQMLAERFSLENIKPLVVADDMAPHIGAGRTGSLARQTKFAALLEQAKSIFALPNIRYAGDLEQDIKCIAMACGSGGSFLNKAASAGCNALITGEATFHTCLEAKALDIGLVLLGHYTSERFALEVLADRLQKQFSEMAVWCSRNESDPIQFA